MAVGQFEPELLYTKEDDKWLIDATGSLELATGDNAEEPMAVCTRIFQGGTLLAKCSSTDHADSSESFGVAGRWSCHGHATRQPTSEPAAALAILITGVKDGGFATYSWGQLVTLAPETESSGEAGAAHEGAAHT
jgi:hypothetical protein